jgi:hypothetical protein
MRYALLIVDPETANPSPEPSDEAETAKMMAEYGAYTRMLRDRGAYLGGEALQPNPTATTVRVEDGRTITTDGPFIEAKEALGGFYLVEARDLDEAIEFAAACPERGTDRSRSDRSGRSPARPMRSRPAKRPRGRPRAQSRVRAARTGSRNRKVRQASLRSSAR